MSIREYAVVGLLTTIALLPVGINLVTDNRWYMALPAIIWPVVGLWFYFDALAQDRREKKAIKQMVAEGVEANLKNEKRSGSETENT